MVILVSGVILREISGMWDGQRGSLDTSEHWKLERDYADRKSMGYLENESLPHLRDMSRINNKRLSQRQQRWNLRNSVSFNCLFS